MQTYENNREQNKQENKLLPTNFEAKIKKGKVERLITYSTDQQIFKLKSILELTKKYGEFILIFNQFIVNGPLMPFYNTWIFM